MIGLNAAQIRKDFSYFGEFGTRGVGYEVTRLIDEITRTLGLDHTWNVIIVGAGLLGTALARYRGFSEQGFRLVGMFDSSATVIGASYGSGRVRGIGELEEFCRARAGGHRHGHRAGRPRRRRPSTASLARASRRSSTSRRCGCTRRTDVLVRQVDLSSELMFLSFYLDQGPRGERA